MWVFLQRASVFLLTVLTSEQILSKILHSKNIQPEKVYTPAELASVLNLEKGVILQLIKSGELQARKIGGKYRILGQNALDFLKK